MRNRRPYYPCDLFRGLLKNIRSPLPPAELLSCIRGAILPPLGWRDFFKAQPDLPFRGRAGVKDFEISRVITGRNAMLPQITGWVEPEYPTGSRLRLRHRLNPLALGLATLWLCLVSMSALGITAFWLVVKHFSSSFLIPVEILLFGTVLFTVPFWLEVRKSRPLLIKLLKLEPLPQE